MNSTQGARQRASYRDRGWAQSASGSGVGGKPPSGGGAPTLDNASSAALIRVARSGAAIRRPCFLNTAKAGGGRSGKRQSMPREKLAPLCKLGSDGPRKAGSCDEPHSYGRPPAYMRASGAPHGCRCCPHPVATNLASRKMRRLAASRPVRSLAPACKRTSAQGALASREGFQLANNLTAKLAVAQVQ